jgi:peptidoglycan/LPS O-acetylase OafA/YrhL
MIYRREIDGLRTVAVVPVILFHAGLTLFSGGYVGVDVFFVISGYLITSTLISELEAGNFSIARFYERRARRILPALFFVMLCCIPFAWVWMPPDELKDFSKSVVAVVFFASNILFWRDEGYFAPTAELKPLLHTWSLAVEEQYYLLFPILLLLTWRVGRNRVFWLILATAAISLAVSEWGWRNKPSANFYLAPTRAWELLTGSVCAFWLSGREQRGNNWLSLAGLVLIVFAIFYYDDATPSPSVYILVPVLGTALIIVFGGPGTWAAKLLSTRSFVGIGLISYSAYLWHQPLFAFARIRSIFEPSPKLMAALVVLSFMLAYFSWRYVETPFRKGQASILPTRRTAFVASVVVGSAFLTSGLVGYMGRGFESRFSENLLHYKAAEKDIADRKCHFDFNRPLALKTEKQCVMIVDGKVDVMFLGDSHMGALYQGLRVELDRQRQSYYILSHTSCLPFFGLKFFDGSKEYDCQDFVQKSFKWASENGVRTIVLSARFPLYQQGFRYDNGEGGREVGDCGFVDLWARDRTKCDDPVRRRRVLAIYESSLRELSKSFNIVLVYPIPEAGWNVPKTAFKKLYFRGNIDNLSTSYRNYQRRTHDVIGLFDRLVTELPNVYAARVDKVLCSEITGRCINADDKGVYYYDDDHLSNAGARLVAPVIVEAVRIANGRAR